MSQLRILYDYNLFVYLVWYSRLITGYMVLYIRY